ncbi:MAG: toxin [Parcubacteria group bacterium CG11_big_fil_rev_8_21_14_0_20_39_22]|nr:MAG: toxin [Parcubacteria group bacterium CG11_big_fil_rev_8_21_14_0_20_39_22]
MWYYDWDDTKNQWLKQNRGVSFEEVVMLIESNNLLDLISNTSKYPGQRVFVIDIEGYAYLVPFVEEGQRIFLKTLFPSRKATKKYIKN